MTIDRLIGILSILLREEQATAASLAARFEVSPRTIQRDVDRLCRAGIPLRTVRGAGGGISILEGYAVKQTVLRTWRGCGAWTAYPAQDITGSSWRSSPLPAPARETIASPLTYPPGTAPRWPPSWRP